MPEDCVPLEELEFVALDLETTGLFPISCRIVELGAVRFRLDGTELACFEQLVDPGCPIPWDATRVHRITDAMVRGQPGIRDVLPGFLEFLGGPETVLMAHNAAFDLGFLAMAIVKQGLPRPPYRVLDTLELSRARLRGLPTHRLEYLASRLGIAESEDHRALADARLAMELFRKLAAREPPLKSRDELFTAAPPLGFEDDGVPAIEPPAGCEQLTLAIAERRTIVILYDGGPRGLARRRVIPRALLHSGGRPYLTAFCHRDRIEKTYRLDKIRGVYVEEHEGRMTKDQGPRTDVQKD